MLILKSRNLVKVVFLSSAFLCTTSAALAQTPTPAPTPQTNPAQRDATKPPASEQNHTVPEAAPPNTPNPQAPQGAPQNPPTAPPGASQTSPTAPPGTNDPQPLSAQLL